MIDFTDVPEPSIVGSQRLTALREKLVSLDFVFPRISERLGFKRFYHWTDELDLMANIGEHIFRFPVDHLDHLIWLFLFNMPVPIRTAEKIFAPADLSTLEDTGLVMRVGRDLISRHTLSEIRGLYVASDTALSWQATRHLNPVMSVYPETHELAGTTVRAPVERALDVGTGSGVHGMLASRHAKEVHGIDLNPRAIAFAKFNKALNGITNIELAVEDLQKVTGRYDLIVADPPYLPVGDSRPGENLYAGGRTGDELTTLILSRLDETLSDSGYCQMLTLFTYWKGRDPVKAILDRLPGGREAFDVLFLWRRLDRRQMIESLCRFQEVARDPALEENVAAFDYGTINLRRSRRSGSLRAAMFEPPHDVAALMETAQSIEGVTRSEPTDVPVDDGPTLLRLPELPVRRVAGKGGELAFVEMGAADGPAVFVFHGTPGVAVHCRLFDGAAKRAGIRLVVPDRPGYGHSTYDEARRLTDWPADVSAIADALGIERFGVAGFSGGGPHAAACAHALRDRLLGCAIASGVAPLALEGALKGTLPQNVMFIKTLRAQPTLTLRRLQLSLNHGRLFPERTIAALERMLAPADREVLSHPWVRALFIDQNRRVGAGSAAAAAQDFRLFSEDWGFALEDIAMPVHIFQGGKDRVVPPHQGRAMADAIPGAVLHEYPAEGHLSFITHADEVLAAASGLDIKPASLDTPPVAEAERASSNTGGRTVEPYDAEAEASLKTRIEGFFAAVAAGDLNALMAPVEIPELVYWDFTADDKPTTARGSEAYNASLLAFGMSVMERRMMVETTLQSIECHASKDLGYCTCEYDQSFTTEEGTTGPYKFRATVIARRTPDDWIVTHFHASFRELPPNWKTD